jgi:hypothetical protein
MQNKGAAFLIFRQDISMLGFVQEHVRTKIAFRARRSTEPELLLLLRSWIDSVAVHQNVLVRGPFYVDLEGSLNVNDEADSHGAGQKHERRFDVVVGLITPIIVRPSFTLAAKLFRKLLRLGGVALLDSLGFVARVEDSRVRNSPRE